MSFSRWALGILLALAVELPAPTSASDTPKTFDWGELPKYIAQLTWAETNCMGSAIDSIRELRLFMRKNKAAEFAEVMLREGNAFRTEELPYGIDRRVYACTAVNLRYGVNGSQLPGLWQPTTQERRKERKTIKWNHPTIWRLGDWAAVLGRIHLVGTRCAGGPTPLAIDLMYSLIELVGSATLKEGAVEGNTVLMFPDEQDLDAICRELAEEFGTDTPQLPRLWHDRRKTPHAPTGASTRSRPPVASTGKTIAEHGFVRRRSSANAVAPFFVKTGAGSNYFFKLVRTSDNLEELSGFIIGGEPLSIKVPVGTYELRYAAGQDWIDEHELFGSETTFAKADSHLIFSRDGEKVHGVEVQLIQQRGGNLRTSRIKREAF